MRRELPPARGEAARVASRVRELLGEHEDGAYDGGADDTRPIRRVAPDPGPAERWTDTDEPAPRATWNPPAWDRGDSTWSGGTPSLLQRALARIPVRLDPGRRGALAVGAAVLLAAVITGIWLMSARPRSVAVSAAVPSVPGASPLVGTDGPVAMTATSASPVATATASDVVVDVAGKVRRPGLYHLPVGSRIDDAITAAGGPRHGVDLSSLNLAAPLLDGQQIAVGVPPAASGPLPPAGAAGTGGAGASSATTIVDLNTASLDQLETLPGVGPVLGQHILDYRTEHGSFTSIDQLQDVSGIGDVTFAGLQPLVSL